MDLGIRLPVLCSPSFRNDYVSYGGVWEARDEAGESGRPEMRESPSKFGSRFTLKPEARASYNESLSDAATAPCTVPITPRRLRHLDRQLDRILDFVASRGFPPVHDRSAGDSRDGLQQVGLWDVPVLA